MKKTTLKIKKPLIPALIAIAFCLTNAPQIKTQKPNNFSAELKSFGLTHFGYSAPAEVLDEKFGFTVGNICREIEGVMINRN